MFEGWRSGQFRRKHGLKQTQNRVFLLRFGALTPERELVDEYKMGNRTTAFDRMDITGGDSLDAAVSDRSDADQVSQ
jgi:hypothetical protein